MSDNRNAVEDHENGIRYGGKILSLIPAPEGWFVGTQVSQHNRKTKETTHDTRQIFPLIGWALVDAMFRGGSRETQVEPLFLSDSGAVTHATKFRWEQGAGDVDEDGWSTSVTVDVIPGPAGIPAFGSVPS
ncbi:hypothetical protein [Streptomyces ureilyticus]|uniref:Phage tail protein n=1 Tax=Streptomyces ureilyticus TaxID=1775131 RepID=A0ABX0DPK4_9ACTN|nr:hypothetical protein [Streptomyces ureilyticus]NGO43791.1 hypothetical protein [Streptomyces ureilyticus]